MAFYCPKHAYKTPSYVALVTLVQGSSDLYGRGDN